MATVVPVMMAAVCAADRGDLAKLPELLRNA